MADVTGDLGGQPIQLNNAATEATLKQLVAAVSLMAAKSGKDAKTQKQLESELKRFASQLEKAGKIVDRRTREEAKLTEEQKKAVKAAKAKAKADAEAKAAQEKLKKAQLEYADRLEATAGVVRLFSNSIDSVGNKIFDLAKDLSNLGDNIENVGSMFREIPVFGGLVANAFSAVAASANKTYDAFTQMSSVGANFGGSIQSMQTQLASTGLTIDQFAAVVKNNSEGLALLGGTVQGGVKRFSNLSKELRNSPLGAELTKLGFTTEQINNGMAGFVGTLARTGAARGMTDTQLAAASANYLKNLDAVSRLTGQSREDLEKQRAERMRDSQFRLMVSKMDADSQANLHALMDSIPKEHAAGLKEIMATGTATSEEGVKALAYLRQMGVDAQSFGQQVRSTGKLTKDQMVAFGEQYQRGATQFAKSGLADTLGKFGDEGDKAFVAASLDVAARSKTFGEAMSESAAAAKRAKEAGLTPEDMAKNKQALADLSNQFTAILANSKLLPALLSAFKSTLETLGPVLESTLNFIGENGTLVAIGLGVVAGTLLVYKFALAAATLAIQLETAKRMGLVTPLGALGKMFGMVGGIGKILGVALKTMLGPVGLVVLGIVGLVKGLEYLSDQGWTLSDVFSGVKDWWADLMGFFGQLIDDIRVKLPATWGGISKDEHERRKSIRDGEKRDREAAARTREEERKSRKEKIANEKAEQQATTQSTNAKNKEIKASGEVVEAKEEEAEAIINPAGAASPDEVLRQFMQQQRRPSMTPGTQPPSTVPATPPGAMPQVPADMQSYLAATALIESGGNPLAKAKTSSAGGMFQFIDSTWAQMTKEMGKNYTMQDKFDPAKAAEVMAYFTQKQKAQLEKGTGRQASNTDLYMAHFLGAGGATKFLNAMQTNPNQTAAALDPAAARANQSIYYDQSGRARSLQEVYNLMAQKMSKAEQAVAGNKWGGKELPAAVAALKDQIPSGRLPGMQSPSVQVATAAGSSRTAPTPRTGSAPTPQTVQTAVSATSTTTTPTSPTPQVAVAAPAPKPTQESAESLLASLNNKMDQLIAISTKSADTSEKQLRTTSGMAGDLYITAA